MVRSATPETNHSLGDLVAQAAKDISQLVRYEIELAKSELKVDLKRILVAAVLAAVAAVFGCLIIIMLCFAWAYFLHWWGAPGGLAGAFGFTALTVAVFASIALLLVRKLLRNLTKMSRTRKTMTDDVAMLRGNGNGTSPGAGGDAARGVPAGGPARGVPAGGAGELASADGKPAPLPGPSAG